MISGRPAFQQHAKRTEGSDTTPHLARSESTAHRVKKQRHHQVANRSRSPAGPRRLRDSDAHKRIAVPEALCVLLEYTRPRPKSGKVCRSDTRPGDVRERAVRVEGNDSAPSEMPPVSACEPLCALAGAKTDNDSAPGDFEQLLADFRCTEIGAGERHWRFSRQCLFTAARSASCRKGLRVLEIDAFFEGTGTV